MSKYNIINPTDYGIYNLQLELFTSKDEVLKHPNRTKSFVDAIIKGWEYALQNTDEIIDIIYKKYSKNIPKESLKYEAEITKRLILPNIYRIGSFDKNFLNRQLDIFKNNYEIKNDKALEDFLYLNKNKQTSISLTPQEKQYLKKYPVLKVHNEINCHLLILMKMV
ncbi:MAG: ABC transporter substrate-binding protein [Campylobacterota bacterium]|nr:ABC transporter substrate-binding protein [Campylobacterota bacterium]